MNMKFKLFSITVFVVMAVHLSQSARAEFAYADVFQADIPYCTSSQEFNINNAYWLALASNVAYEDHKTIERFQKNLPEFKMSIERVAASPDLIKQLPGVSTEILLAESDTDLILAIRGTEPKDTMDLMNDTAIKTVPWLKNENREQAGKVHIGFNTLFESAWPSIEQKLRSIQNKNIWFTGHSLGAAGATLLHIHLATLKKSGDFSSLTLRPLYNFGSPRIGDKKFASEIQFDKNIPPIFRIRNYRDSVTLMPITKKVPFGNYQHVGELVYIDKSGKIYFDVDEDEIGTNWIDFNIIKFFWGFRYHRLEKYIKNLLRYARTNTSCESSN
ncbi:MAG: lipase family protein [Bdellovibrionales bacterium]|nr:lipase family protein [Bdellovibrionales bacterium]